MQIEAIYDNGRVKFLQPVQLKHEQFKITIELPDAEVVLLSEPAESDSPDAKQWTQVLSQRSLKLRNKLSEIRNSPVPHDDEPMTEEDAIRWTALTEIREMTK